MLWGSSDISVKIWCPTPPPPGPQALSAAQTSWKPPNPTHTHTHTYLGHCGAHGSPIRSFTCARTQSLGPLETQNTQYKLGWDILHPGSLGIGGYKNINTIQFSYQLTMHDLGEEVSRQREKWMEKPKTKELTLSSHITSLWHWLFCVSLPHLNDLFDYIEPIWIMQN